MKLAPLPLALLATLALALCAGPGIHAAAAQPARQPSPAPQPVTGPLPPAPATPPVPATPAPEEAPPSPAPAPADAPAEPPAAEGDLAEPVPTLVVDSGALGAETCEQLAAEGRPAPPPAASIEVAPVLPWTEWALSGELIDNPVTLRAVLDGVMQARRVLTATARKELAGYLRELGYDLAELRFQRLSGNGLRAILQIAPLPLIRSVSVRTDLDLSITKPWAPFTTVLLDDEVERRMRLRAGFYLPVDPAARACEIIREKRRIADYLRDEGFFEAEVDLKIDLDKRGAARVAVKLELGPEYRQGVIAIAQAGGLALPAQEIRGQFRHQGTCVLSICFGSARFTRAQHQADLKRLTELYKRRGFPAVRVQSNFDPRTSFDRPSKTVKFTLTIDERRRIDVVFEGHDPDRISDDKLREVLTFNAAGSADDVEVAESAAKLTQYLQGRGYFEARVTWKRERFRPLDQVVFRISMGNTRRVRSVSFASAGGAPLHFSHGELLDLIGTRPYDNLIRLFGNAPPVTSQQLDDDASRIIRAYRQKGYRHTRVEVNAGPTPESLSSVALATAQISGSRNNGGIHVRFRIDEGPLSYVRRLEIHLPGTPAGGLLATAEDQELCKASMRALAAALVAPRVLETLDPRRCAAEAYVVYLEENVDRSTEALRELLRSQARPDSTVDLAPTEDGTNFDLRFHVADLQPRKLGKVLLRGNFRTDSGIIRNELGFREGQPLTSELSSEGQSRLRATGLFDRVSIAYLEGDGVKHAIVQIEERYDSRVQGELEGGISTVTNELSTFGKVGASVPNLFGIGLTGTASMTLGTELTFYEATLRIPRFLLRRIFRRSLFDAELNAFWREQNTDRFGNLLTKGFTVATSRSWQRNHTPTQPGRLLSTGLRYDFRLRDRQLESIRPAGVDSDESQIPVTTRSGALALSFEWEQRITRSGALAPLSPEDGFRLEASVAFASPALFGQDTFLKLGGSAQVYWPLGKKLLLRTDLRYDHGIPLGGESVLPEVERFFAGGDSTVRGYDEDRLATEIIEQGVPPYSSTRQVRVLAAGGNIRAIASVDAQLRITGPLAAAMFSDAGIVTNDWRAADTGDIRPGAGMAVRVILPFGAVSLEYAVPLRPRLGDDPRGRIHFGFAMRFD